MTVFDIIDGETVAICAAPRNWEEQIKLDVTLPTRVTRGVSARETRACFASNNRYAFDYRFDSSDAFDSTNLRLWLVRLKTERVAVPLWTDVCTLANNAAIGATSLTITGPGPVRYGSKWIFLSPDNVTYEVVILASIVDNTINIISPGLGLAWPAGSVLFPILFGRLTERPKFDDETDEVLSARLKFTERSAWDKRIVPIFVSLPTVGSHVPDFSSYRLWNMAPTHVRMLDTTEADILYKQIGFGREEQQYAFPNWNRRAMEFEFLCDSRAQINFIERFFIDRLATTKPFFIPTFRSDLKLAADVAAGATAFEIEESRYEDAAYDDHPGSAFLAFVDPTGVYPQRITEVDLTTITPQIPVGEAHAAIGTKVSFLVLARLVEPKLSWIFDTDGVGTCRIKVVEVADEYVTPNTSYQIGYLYHFIESLPNESVIESFFTSNEYAIVYGGDTYNPAPFSHDRIKATLNLNDSVQLWSWGVDFAANPLKRFLPYTLQADLQIEILKYHLDTAVARQLFVGSVLTLQTKGADWRATCGLSKKFNRKVPGMVFQSTDNFTQFDPPTQLDAADFKVTGTITALSIGGDTMRITVSGPTDADNWFSNGWLDTGAALNQQARSILESTVAGSLQTLTIDRPLDPTITVVGQSIDLYPGYDGTREQCDDKFDNNINFGGHPFRPLTNPSVKANEIKTPTGGKK